MLRSVVAALVVVVGLGALSGCGGSGTSGSVTSAESENGPMAQIGSLYRAYWEKNSKAPSGMKDFAIFADDMPEGVNAIRSGDIVVIWGAKLEDLTLEGTGDSDDVLAYEKDAPSAGGYVLLKNRKIRKMTAEEFQAAPKAEGTTEEPTRKSK